MKIEKVSILGAGSWGTAIAIMLANKGCDVTLWSAVESEINMLKTNREHKDRLPGAILPENISLYNNIIDSPLLVQDSKEFYYNKRINELIDDETFSASELYKALIILGERKGTFEKVLDENNIKAYINKSNKKIYTNVTKF